MSEETKVDWWTYCDIDEIRFHEKMKISMDDVPSILFLMLQELKTIRKEISSGGCNKYGKC